jgi:hypothetical protein
VAATDNDDDGTVPAPVPIDACGERGRRAAGGQGYTMETSRRANRTGRGSARVMISREKRGGKGLVSSRAGAPACPCVGRAPCSVD